jgi:hypothetical protein
LAQVWLKLKSPRLNQCRVDKSTMAPLRTSCLAALLPLVAASSIDPSNTAFQYVGRWDFQNPSAPAFQWAGSSISFELTCRDNAAVSATFDTNEKYTKFGIYLGNDMASPYQLLEAGTSDVKLKLPSGRSIVTIVKATEDLKPDPAQGSSSMLMKPAVFRGLTTEEAGACTISAVPRKERRMQFIGDSITCGFGNQATSVAQKAQCAFDASHTTITNFIGKSLYELEDTHESWSMVLARKFGADAHVQCLSGIGMCRNGIGFSPSNPHNMTYFIDRTLPFTATSPSNMWDYSKYQPDVLVVNLGTNDYIASTGPLAPTYESFQAHYVAFVTRLMSNYQASKTKVLLVCGPMTSRQCPYVEAAATQLSKSFHAEYVRTDISTSGCVGHPNQAEDAKMVELIVPAVEKLTGWSDKAIVV